MSEKQKYIDLLSLRKYDDNIKQKQDKIYFVIEENVIGTEGNFICFTGLPKAGKSTFISAFIASALSKNTILDLKVFLYIDKPKIALFDTEQSGFDLQRSVARIKQLSGINKFKNNFDIYLFREDYSNDIVKLIYTYLLQNSDCGIIIIDGLLDLVNNMNDEGEAKRIIRLFKKWGKQFNVLIVTVLHQGKKDFNSIGHLGSSVDRYAQSVLDVIKEKDGTITLKPKMLRSSAGFTDINIFFNHNTKQYEKSF